MIPIPELPQESLLNSVLPMYWKFTNLYYKLHPTLVKYHEAGYNDLFEYKSTKSDPVFMAGLSCTIQCNAFSGRIILKAPNFYKGNSQDIFVTRYIDPLNPDMVSTFGGQTLISKINKDSDCLFKSNQPPKVIQVLDSYDTDDLEAMEFQLLTRYDACETTAIMMHQVLRSFDGCQFAVHMPSMVGLEEARMKAIQEVFYSTIQGLEHECSKVT